MWIQNQKCNFCGSKTKKKNELVWIQNRKNGANGASGAFHHRAESARWAIAADPEVHFFYAEPAAARQDACHERAELRRAPHRPPLQHADSSRHKKRESSRMTGGEREELNEDASGSSDSDSSSPRAPTRRD